MSIVTYTPYVETCMSIVMTQVTAISGFDLITYRFHAKYGRAMYVKKDKTHHFSTEHCNVVKIGLVSITNFRKGYKSTSETWDSGSPLPACPHPAVYLETSTVTILTGVTVKKIIRFTRVQLSI